MTNIGFISPERAPTKAQQQLSDLNRVREYAGLPANKISMRVDIDELKQSGHPLDVELAEHMEMVFFK